MHRDDVYKHVLGRKPVDRVHVVVAHVSTLGRNVFWRHGVWELRFDYTEEREDPLVSFTWALLIEGIFMQTNVLNGK
jgi:hypothetical protein